MPARTQAVSKARLGVPLSLKNKLALSHAKTGSKNFKLSLMKIGKPGYKNTAESKKHHRQGMIRHLEKVRFSSRCIGNNEKDLLDLQEILFGIKILRQFHIKELGYIVDGYCSETNTIFEVYEKHHCRQQKKDQERQNEIQKLLNCNFKIIKDEYPTKLINFFLTKNRETHN